MKRPAHVLLLSIFALFLCLNLFPIASLQGQTLARDHHITDSAIQQLKTEIAKILEETGVPAAGISFVHRSGVVFSAGFGESNIERHVRASDTTVFRCASVSKMVTALCILELEREGKLSLQDKVRDVVPDVKFTNAWEKSEPIRIVHLLNHTTGWDDIHSSEMAHNDSVPISLKDALNFHPHSRVSRWVPGTRKAYSSSGYGVAAAVVEKVSGLTYEEFAYQKILKPLRMNKTTFFNDSTVRQNAAVGYNRNLHVVPYRNVIYRAAGGMNSTPRDMANLIEFFLKRDSVGPMPHESIRKMETPQGTPGARAGLQLGYSLGNETSIYRGFVFQGHSGTLDGALCELAYLPEHGMGHVLFVNATKPDAFSRISTLLRNFETGLCVKSNNADISLPVEVLGFKNGYYVPINPRNQSMLFMDYVIGVERIELLGHEVTKSWIFSPGQKQRYLATSDSTFILSGTDKVGMVKTVDPLAGEVLYFDHLVMKRIPGIVVVIQIVVLVLWIISGLASVLCWFFLRVMLLFDPTRSRELIRFYSFTAVTTVLYFVLIVLLKFGLDDYDNSFSRPGPLSVAVALISVSIAITAFMSMVVIYQNRHFPRGKLYVPIFLTLMHVVVTGYLIAFDVIPVITWA